MILELSILWLSALLRGSNRTQSFCFLFHSQINELVGIGVGQLSFVDESAVSKFVDFP